VLGLGGHALDQGPQVLPPECRPERRARGAVPQDGGRALRRDADPGHGSPGGEGGGRGVDRGGRHLGGIELHQARRRGARREGPSLQCVDRPVRADDGGAQPAGADIDHEDAGHP
jgi:hypothetical protein